MSVDEHLSRLLSGELTGAEAQALQRRIDTEPEVAARWQALQALVSDLGDLPDAMTPPALAARAVAAPASRRWMWPAAALLAALLLGWFLLPTPPTTILVEGSQWVQGHTTLLAGDATVEVDGRARIFVEPPGPFVRASGHDREEPMNKQTLLAALGGAVVTVAVYEGTAVVHAGAAGDSVVVQAGETRTLGQASSNVPTAPVRQVGGESTAERIARLEAQLDQAQQQLAEAEFTGALTRGQLAAHQGLPSDWPDGVPGPFTPDQFEQALAARLADIPDVQLSRVDCSEYPCVAAVRYLGSDDSDGWSDALGQVVGGWATETLGEEHLSLSVNQSRFRNNDHDARYVIFGAHTDGRNSDVGTRTDFRIDQLVDELGQEVHEEAAQQ